MAIIFENQEINTAELPSIATANYQKLAKNYVKVRSITTILFFLVLLLGIITLHRETDLIKVPTLTYGIVAFWAIWFIASLVLVKKSYDIQGYVLREKDIIHRKGVLFRSTTTIPFNRVQHCEISQGPVQRNFNLYTLDIFTAGGSKSDLAIPGLEGDTAQQIKEYIVKKTDDAEQDTAATISSPTAPRQVEEFTNETRQDELNEPSL